MLKINIRGLNIDGVDILLSLLADDTDLFLGAMGENIDRVINEFTRFGSVSGCNANIDKTRIIPLGTAKSNVDLIRDITIKYGTDFVSTYNDFCTKTLYHCWHIVSPRLYVSMQISRWPFGG